MRIWDASFSATNHCFYSANQASRCRTLYLHTLRFNWNNLVSNCYFLKFSYRDRGECMSKMTILYSTANRKKAIFNLKSWTRCEQSHPGPQEENLGITLNSKDKNWVIVNSKLHCWPMRGLEKAPVLPFPLELGICCADSSVI